MIFYKFIDKSKIKKWFVKGIYNDVVIWSDYETWSSDMTHNFETILQSYGLQITSNNHHF